LPKPIIVFTKYILKHAITRPNVVAGEATHMQVYRILYQYTGTHNDTSGRINYLPEKYLGNSQKTNSKLSNMYYKMNQRKLVTTGVSFSMTMLSIKKNYLY